MQITAPWVDDSEFCTVSCVCVCVLFIRYAGLWLEAISRHVVIATEQTWERSLALFIPLFLDWCCSLFPFSHFVSFENISSTPFSPTSCCLYTFLNVVVDSLAKDEQGMLYVLFIVMGQWCIFEQLRSHFTCVIRWFRAVALKIIPLWLNVLMSSLWFVIWLWLYVQSFGYCLVLYFPAFCIPFLSNPPNQPQVPTVYLGEIKYLYLDPGCPRK